MSAKVRMVMGPARVTVSGNCQVLGADVSNKRIIVRSGKVLPFEGSCGLRVRLGRGGTTWKAPPEIAGVSMWHDVVKNPPELGTVMLVGETDTGKSTLSTYLLNVALSHDLTPCMIDGDIGQGDLAPPMSIGAAVISQQVTDLRDISANIFEFVGNISPAGFEHFMAAKLKSILERVRQLGDIFIINTDGYLRNGGVQYKLLFAKQIQPDLIVYLGENPLLPEAFDDGPWRVLHARPNSQVAKTRRERYSRRLDQFLRYVGRRTCVVDLSRIRFVYLDRIFSPLELSRPPIAQLKQENLDRMFVGLGSNNQVRGFGIITDISKESMTVRTDLSSFDRIYLGNIRFSIDSPVEIKVV